MLFKRVRRYNDPEEAGSCRKGDALSGILQVVYQCYNGTHSLSGSGTLIPKHENPDSNK